jgi:hypothetical protein
MVKGFNEAWRNSGRKESEISIRAIPHRKKIVRKSLQYGKIAV